MWGHLVGLPLVPWPWGLLIQERPFGQKLSCSLHRGLPARLALDWHLETWPWKLSRREEVVLVAWPRLFVQMM